MAVGQRVEDALPDRVDEECYMVSSTDVVPPLEPDDDVTFLIVIDIEIQWKIDGQNRGCPHA
jgi:hypothetical protein